MNRNLSGAGRWLIVNSMTELNEWQKQILSAKRVDLSHDVHAGIPRFPAFNPMTERTVNTIEEHRFFAKEYTLATPYGTHIDAPGHFAAGKRLVDAIGADELILPLFVLHLEDSVAQNPDHGVTVEDIGAFEAEHGEIPAGSFVAFSSNWHKRWDDPDAFVNHDDNGVQHTPGWTLDALKFLVEERNVSAIGHETLDTDPGVVAAETGFLYGELYVLEQNIYQVEVMTNLDQVPATGAVIVVGPPKIQGAPSITSRVFALFNN